VFIFLPALCAGELVLLTTGLIGMAGLCSFKRAFTFGGDGFLWMRNFTCLLLMILSHCCKVFYISLWYLLVGSLVMVRK
jgi:hypothetical protein